MAALFSPTRIIFKSRKVTRLSSRRSSAADRQLIKRYYGTRYNFKLIFSGKSAYQKLSVYDIEDYTVTAAPSVSDVDFTRAQCALAATWRPTTTTGKAPDRYEWGVGVEGEPMGQELLNVAKEPLWREIGHTNMALFTTASSRMLGREVYSSY